MLLSYYATIGYTIIDHSLFFSLSHCPTLWGRDNWDDEQGQGQEFGHTSLSVLSLSHCPTVPPLWGGTTGTAFEKNCGQ